MALNIALYMLAVVNMLYGAFALVFPGEPDQIDQQLASVFHRNHRINDEDGIILEEFRVEYVADRVNTTGRLEGGVVVVVVL